MSQDAVNRPQIAPYPLALVVCDGYWRDPYTGKCTLIGTFSALKGQTFPLHHPIMTIYMALTDGVGLAKIRLQLVDCDELREPIFMNESEIELQDPRVVFEMVVQETGMQFPEPGEYRLQLFANDEFAMERRIVVLGPHPEQESDDLL